MSGLGSKRGIAPFLVAAAGGVMLAAVGVWKYGTIGASVLALQGYSLEVTPNMVTLASIKAGDESVTNVRVRNIDSKPVTIVGSRTNCTCTMAKNLPMTIAGGDTRELQVTLTASKRDIGNELSGHVMLYLDSPGPPIYILVTAKTVVP